MHVQITSEQRGLKWTKTAVTIVLDEDESLPNRLEVEMLMRQAIKEMPSSTSMLTHVRLQKGVDPGRG